MVVGMPLVLLPLIWKWVLTPAINPYPKDVLTISGAFPFDKGYDLILSQSAYTTNPFVNFVCGGFGAVRGMQGISCRSDLELVQPRRIDCCNYEFVLYRDRYLSGIAGWKLMPYHYRAYSRETATSKGLMNGLPPKAVEMVCPDSKEDLVDLKGKLLCFDTKVEGPDVYDTKTHQVKLNFLLESENPTIGGRK
ncbi:hypothetical protein [Rhodoferax sp.]|uniref:hypothetical protein n=1 Tax=Rhodoferax sp. TaxID=50421 RepID=UPI00271F6C0F|nr:hypothetical protein [Rhodoferax sp.]MDO9199651.1 hypothetical protein [Rhodoferax sp.]